MTMAKPGSKALLKQFFLDNIGKVITAAQLRDAAWPATAWPRRVREIRDGDGWHILTNNDRTGLKPGQYLLEEFPPKDPPIKSVTFIPADLRAQVLDRDGFTCQWCGVTPGDIDLNTRRKVRLHVGHIVDQSLGGKTELSNLRALCSTCNQGAKNITAEKPTSVWLLAQIRRAGQDEQQHALKWLRKKFGN